jgi:quinone-modifying oxidoreductase subunit QmoC
MTADAAPATTPRRLRPDRDFLRAVLVDGGEDLKQCMQCATCSAVCQLAGERGPGPRKEMLWAQWGLADRLLGDPDPWLCHQCGDCTVRCPRGARPGDVMAALRRACVVHHATPRALGRWLNRAASLPWLVAGALASLCLAAWIGQVTGLAALALAPGGGRIVIPFWNRLPQGWLGAVFGLLFVLDLAVLARGGRRFWRAMGAHLARERSAVPARGRGAALARAIFQDDFGLCGVDRGRRLPHLLVSYGMVALALTSLWVVTARWNPLLDGLVYPLGFCNPWKLMANLAGLSVALGATLMLVDRWRRPQTAGATRYADGLLLGLLLAIVLTGLGAEALHLLRCDSLRVVAYLFHLVAVFVLLVVAPYSNLAHVWYRTLALLHAERAGRGRR